MPGKMIKNWRMYHGLRRHGFSKARAAAISNGAMRRKRRRAARRRR